MSGNYPPGCNQSTHDYAFGHDDREIEERKAEEDGDEILTPADHCYGCRLGFQDDKPVYAPLAAKNGFLCCIVCGASYGPVTR